MNRVKIGRVLQYLDECNIVYEYMGSEEIEITGFSSLGQYSPGSITWIKKITPVIPDNIFLAVVQEGVEVDVVNKIISKDSKFVFFSILEHFFGDKKTQNPIGKGTYISPAVQIGKNVIIGHNCTLDGEITIGDNTVIYNNVNIINKVSIATGCEIQSCVNIGHDGFGFTENNKGQKTMVKHYGGVAIGDHVYIGGNTYIERGTIDNTVIGNGTKIDGSCLIGHNSTIGENVAMVAGTIVFGSVAIEDGAYIASATLKNKIHVGQDALIGMGSAVTKDVEKGTVVAGVPARKIR